MSRRLRPDFYKSWLECDIELNMGPFLERSNEVQTGSPKPPNKGRFAGAMVEIDENDRRLEKPLTHSELIDRLREGRAVLDCVIEAVPQADSKHPLYLLFLSCNFSPRGYRVYRVGDYIRPRLFRDLDRVVAMIRNEFFYGGTIHLRLQEKSPQRNKDKQRRHHPPDQPAPSS